MPQCNTQLYLGSRYLSQQKGDYISGLPVAGMEEVGQGHCGEGREGIRAVQGIVNPLLAPPLGSDYREEARRKCCDFTVRLQDRDPSGSPGT